MFIPDKCKTCTRFETCRLGQIAQKTPAVVKETLGRYFDDEGQVCYDPIPAPKEPQLVSCANCIRQYNCNFFSIEDDETRLASCPYTILEENFIDLKALLQECFTN